MINLSDVATGLLGLGVIAGAVVVVALGGQDRAAEGDLSDYHEPSVEDWDYVPAPMPPRGSRRATLRVVRSGRRPIPPLPIDADFNWGYADDILPPAPPGMRVPLPLYAEQVVAELMRARYGTTNAEVIAGRMLVEIAEDELAKAGIGPDGHAWQLDGSCWADCPACARDMTGAFPVVRV